MINFSGLYPQPAAAPEPSAALARSTAARQATYESQEAAEHNRALEEQAREQARIQEEANENLRIDRETTQARLYAEQQEKSRQWKETQARADAKAAHEAVGNAAVAFMSANPTLISAATSHLPVGVGLEIKHPQAPPPPPPVAVPPEAAEMPEVMRPSQQSSQAPFVTSKPPVNPALGGRYGGPDFMTGPPPVSPTTPHRAGILPSDQQTEQAPRPPPLGADVRPAGQVAPPILGMPIVAPRAPLEPGPKDEATYVLYDTRSPPGPDGKYPEITRFNHADVVAGLIGKLHEAWDPIVKQGGQEGKAAEIVLATHLPLFGQGTLPYDVEGKKGIFTQANEMFQELRKQNLGVIASQQRLAAGASKTEETAERYERNDIAAAEKEAVDEGQKLYKFSTAQDAYNTAKKLENLMEKATGPGAGYLQFEELDALARYFHGRAVANAEIQRIVGTGGPWGKLEYEWNRWTDHSQLPKEVLAGMKHATTTLKEAARSAMQNVRNTAEGWVEQDPRIPASQREAARNRVRRMMGAQEAPVMHTVTERKGSGAKTKTTEKASVSSGRSKRLGL